MSIKTGIRFITSLEKKKNLSNIIFVIILISFVIISMTYSLFLPSLEGQDETYHYEYMKKISDGNIDFYSVINLHPPLYYGISAIFLHFIKYPGIIEIPWSPTLDTIHVNFHSYEEKFPYTGTALAVHVLRLFSVFCGAVTLYFTYKITKLLFPKNIWLQLLPLATLVLLPSFSGNESASLNNDVLINVFITISVFYLLKFITNTQNSKFLIYSGIFTGLSLLTKDNAILMYPIFVIFLGYLLFSKQIKIAQFLKSISIFTVVSIIAGGWYVIVQKLLNYGIVQAIMVNASSGTAAGFAKFTWERIVIEYSLQFWSFSAWHGLVRIPAYFNDTGNFLIAISLVGLILVLIKKTKLCKTQLEKNYLFLSMISVVITYSGLIGFDFSLPSYEGPRLQYVFPFISSYVILFSIGLFVFFDRKKIRFLSILPIIFLIVLTFIVLTTMYSIFDNGLKLLKFAPPIDPFKTMSEIYKEDKNLQQNYSQNDTIDYPKMFAWASKDGFKEYDVINNNKPLFDLLSFYYSDKELQNKFPNMENESESSSLVAYSLKNGSIPPNADYDYFRKYYYAVQVGGPEGMCESDSKFTSYDAVKNLKEVFCSRIDLVLAFPNVYEHNDFSGLFQWADTFGYKEEDTLTKHRPFYLMMRVYYSDPELKIRFPEAKNAENIDRYLKWIINYGINQNEILKSNKEYYLNFEKYNPK